MFDKWFDGIFQKGYDAGYNARVIEDHEDQNRRLDDMYQHGKKTGHDEGYMEGYKKGYQAGYEEGEFETQCRIGEIKIDDLDPSVFEEVEADDDNKDVDE